jgi:hypothetical protein
MGWGKRRKGKQSSGRSTPNPPPPEEEEEEKAEQDEHAEKSQEEEEEAEEETKEDPKPEERLRPKSEDADLVLTSEKRRGVYECDYCHSDISQLPRIRCATCLDFDLCLDCFATTDHSSAIARLKAAATAHSELKADGIQSTMVAGISSAAANHDDTHKYRVCDSTRFPIFGSTRNVIKNSKQEEKGDASEVALSKRHPEETEDNNSKSNDKMEVEESKNNKKPSEDSVEPEESEASNMTSSDVMVVSEDPKSIWTAEEDLRLLDAIKTHGLGNWTDVSEAVGGNGSFGKTPKRCMERYFDDFLGRYGHVLPPYTIVDDVENEDNEDSNDELTEDESVRASKRRHSQIMRLPSNVSASSGGGRSRKRFKVVPTESLPGYDQVWLNPYLPPIEGVHLGQEVARDLSTKNELTFVKATAAVATKVEADKIRKEWMEMRMQELGAPTVLPPRPEDSATLPGAELVGFMPRRGDFDIEWENEAESALADMEFTQGDSEQDKQLKLQVLGIYYQKQDEREKRKKFILSRNLYDYRKYVHEEDTLPQDERDLMHRMRLFERFHTPEEHKHFIADIMKAKRLRKEIAKLQMYRRIGIRSLAEAEKYELDKSRRQFHKAAQQLKEAEAKAEAKNKATNTSTTLTPAVSETAATATTQGAESVDSLWKQYRTSDRKVRRSINRTGSALSEERLDDKFKMADTKETRENKKEVTETKEGEDKKEGEENKESEEQKQSKQKENEEKLEGEEKTETEEATDGDAAPARIEKEDDEQKDAMEIDKKETSKAKEDESEPNKLAQEEEKQTIEETKDEKMEVDEEDVFDISEYKGYDLLSRRESALCVRLKIYPAQYLEIKKALIHESLTNGLLDKEGPGSGRRMVVKVDVERRGNILDFMLRAGWISNRLAKAARSVAPVSAAE